MRLVWHLLGTWVSWPGAQGTLWCGAVRWLLSKSKAKAQWETLPTASSGGPLGLA